MTPCSLSTVLQPLAQLSVQPQSAVFTGETVTLTCLVKTYIGWRYKWFKRTTRIELSPSWRHSKDGAVFTIRGADMEDSALYWCQGESKTGHMQSHISNAVHLTVTGEYIQVHYSLISGDAFYPK